MLKKTVSLLLITVMLLTFATFPAIAASPAVGVYNTGSTSLNATKLVYNYNNPANNNFKIVGRNNPDVPTLFAWHASGVEFTVTGTTTVGLRIDKYNKNIDTSTRPSYTSGNTGIYLHVSINGKDVINTGEYGETETYDYNAKNQAWLDANQQPSQNCFEVKKPSGSTKAYDYIFKNDLDPNETYTVRVTLDRESWAQYKSHAVYMTDVLADAGATVTKSDDSERSILFLGDSITSANNIGGVHNSYHQIAAKILGADTQAVSAGGGLFYNKYIRNSNSVATINEIAQISISEQWNLTTWAYNNKNALIPELTNGTTTASNTPDEFATDSRKTFTPDLIVVNIGTNDRNYLIGSSAVNADTVNDPNGLLGDYTTYKDYNRAKFKEKFEDFMQEVRSLYPDAHVILSYGLMTHFSDVINFYEEVVREYKAKYTSEKALTTYNYNLAATKLTDGHPDKYAHAIAGEELATHISTLMNWTIDEGEDDSGDVDDGTATAETYFYPEYPEYDNNGNLILPRDYDYEVYVNDGVNETQIPVYNASRNKNTYVTLNDKSDSYRRFSEFSFDGKVTVKIKVKGQMSSYAVLPSSKGLNSTYDAQTGTISVTLTEAQNFLIRLNDDQNTILSIFAEDLWKSSEVPANGSATNVIVFGEGVNNIEKGTLNKNYKISADGEFSVTSNTKVYLKPGAIVTYRVSVIASMDNTYKHSTESNITIDGRGAFIDPRSDRDNDGVCMFYCSDDNNVTIKNVKFLDAHCFNIHMNLTQNINIDNIKILSSEISSDGISFLGTTTDTNKNTGTVTNSFIYCSDNAFVASSAEGIDITNCVVGTGYGIVFPQGPVSDLLVDNIDVFRMGDLFRATVNRNSYTDTWNITVSNIRAEDALKATAFIRLRDQGTAAKNVTLKNISLPYGSKSESSKYVANENTATSNANFTLVDVFIGGKKVEAFTIEGNAYKNNMPLYYGTYVPGNFNFTFSNTSATLAKVGGGTYSGAVKAKTHTANPTVLAGEGLTVAYYKVDILEKDGLTYIPVAHVLKNLGYTVTTSADGKTVTATDSNTTVTLTETDASNTTLSEKPIMIDGVMMVPTTLMEEVFGLKCGVSDNGVAIQENGYDNLLKDGGFENLSLTIPNSTFSNTNKYARSFDWTCFYHAFTYEETTNVRTGNSAMKVAHHNTQTYYDGVSQHIGDIIKTYGKGTYTFSAYVKLAAASTVGQIGIGLAQSNAYAEDGVWSGYKLPIQNFNQISAVDQSTLSESSWTKVTCEVVVDDNVMQYADVALFFIGVKGINTKNFAFYVDDASITFTPTAQSTETLQTAPYVPESSITSGEKTIYYKWDSANQKAVIDTNKTPADVTINVGDRIDVRALLMQKYPDVDLKYITIKTSTVPASTWYQPGRYDLLYAPEKGTIKFEVTKYFKDGKEYSSSKNSGEFDPISFEITVASDNATSQASSYKYTTINNDNAKLVARTADTAPTAFYWHGSSAEFNFTGKTLGIEVKSQSAQRLIYQIDNGPEQVLNVKGTKAKNSYTYILAENLTSGSHTVKIVKSDETFWGEITLVNAVTDTGATISKPTGTNLKIQFIGDSITSGNSLDNYAQNYAYLTAKELGYDAQMFSISGALMSDFLDSTGNRKSNGGYVIPYLYNGIKISTKNNTGYWNLNTKEGYSFNFDESSGTKYKKAFVPNGDYFASETYFNPDIVVINLGTNDASAFANANTNKELNKETFVNMYANFLTRLSDLYEEADIICSYGMMGADATVVSLIDEAVMRYKTKDGRNNVKAITYTNSSDKAYDFNHPGPISNATAAQELVAAINAGFEPDDTYVVEADANGNVELPKVNLGENNLFLGWYKEDGTAFVSGTKIGANEKISLTPKYIDLTEALTGQVDDGTAIETQGDAAIGPDATYTNGFYYQGIQMRMETDNSGLRFLTARNLKIEDAIETALGSDANFEVRFLVAIKGKLADPTLTVDNYKIDREAKSVYRSAEELGDKDYNKFTICITGLNTEVHRETVIMVRPYFRYTDASGIDHIFYGEQAEKSLYEGAQLIYKDSKYQDEKDWVYENIIRKTTGDNDEEAGDLWG